MSHGIERILCCVGLRADSDYVLHRAISLALATQSELHVLHAVKALPDEMANTLKVNIRDRDVLNTLMEQRIEQARVELKAKLAAFWQRHSDLHEAFGDRKISCTVLEGYPSSVISHFASRGKFDMIVVAANKRSFSASYAGKVTKGVIKRAKVPVVVVPKSS